MKFHLGVLASHPIQYHSPWFRHLAKRMDLEVFYCHRQDGRGQAEAGFGVEFDWDTPLLEGYSSGWLTNVARRPSLQSFHGCDTPEIYDLIKAGRFDAFLIFGWNRKSSLQAVHACWQSRTPVLMRGDSQLSIRRSPLKAVAKYIPYRIFLPRLDAHLYVGRRNKRYLQHYGVAENRLFFAPHFVDNDFFSREAEKARGSGKPSRIREILGIPQTAFVYVFVGKFIAKKRPADFVLACQKILDSPANSDVQALLVGEGELREHCESLASDRRHRIHFLGFRNQTELPAIYKASNALVLPSDEAETWGLVVNEAAACGIPAIVSDAVGCVPDMIDEALTGFSYPMGDINALAHRMLALREICRRSPVELRKALARKMECFSIEQATGGLESALERIVARPVSRTFSWV